MRYVTRVEPPKPATRPYRSGQSGLAMRLLDMGVMAQSADTSTSQLVPSAAAGDEAAFEGIVRAYHDQMRRVCIVICEDEALADDAVQAAWSAAWVKLGSLREPDRLRPWLVSVAANEARDLMRKRRRLAVEVGSDAPTVSGGIDPATGIDSLDVLAAVRRLAPEDRALLAMRYVAGFTATELAAATGLSPSGTRSRLVRLLHGLRQELDHG
jgi:RNA polymerase sigma factor (sigma-70 family)